MFVRSWIKVCQCVYMCVYPTLNKKNKQTKKQLQLNLTSAPSVIVSQISLSKQSYVNKYVWEIANETIVPFSIFILDDTRVLNFDYKNIQLALR